MTSILAVAIFLCSPDMAVIRATEELGLGSKEAVVTASRYLRPISRDTGWEYVAAVIGNTRSCQPYYPTITLEERILPLEEEQRLAKQEKWKIRQGESLVVFEQSWRPLPGSRATQAFLEGRFVFIFRRGSDKMPVLVRVFRSRLD